MYPELFSLEYPARMTSLAVVTITKIAESGNDVILLVELLIDKCSDNFHISVLIWLPLCDTPTSEFWKDFFERRYTFWCRDEVQEDDVLLRYASFELCHQPGHTVLLNENLTRTSTALMALPPVASIGSSRNTQREAMSSGNLE